MILGIDEVGRGAWAGPLVVGAVVLGEVKIAGLTDSKKLTKKRRELLAEQIYNQATGYGLGWVEAGEIDDIGLSMALRLATKRAVQQVKTPYHEIIIDGTSNFLVGTPLEGHVSVMKKADLLIASVSAASIIAKVARDNYMYEQGLKCMGYDFAGNVGYGTAAHRIAIDKLGVTPLHRLSFAPLKKFKLVTIVDEPSTTTTTSRDIGDISESVATLELEKLGHVIIERNWKTKYCEIDIISEKSGTIYFSEVKHRRNSKAGDGLAAITPKKLRQMKFAAKLYSHANKIIKSDLCLLAVATAGDKPVVTSIVEIG